MPAQVSDRQRPADGWRALLLSAAAAVLFRLLATYAPGWWRGAKLQDTDAPLDLEWLHNGFAWMAQYFGPVLFWLFGGMVVLLPVVAAFTSGFTAGSPRFRRAVAAAPAVPIAALLTVAALAVLWFLCTQFASLIAPFLGMYHGEYHPAVT